jgi:hypothetical protein
MILIQSAEETYLALYLECYSKACGVKNSALWPNPAA